MVKLLGLLDYFPKIENASAEMVAKNINFGKSDAILIENEIGNLLLYPQVVPESQEQLQIHLSLVCQAMSEDPSRFLNRNLKRLTIPEFIINRFPDFYQILTAFIDVLHLDNLTTIVMKSDRLGLINLGTYILLPEKVITGSLTLWIGNKSYLIRPNSIQVYQARQTKVDVKISSSKDRSNETSLSSEVSGGNIGLIVDTREKTI